MFPGPSAGGLVAGPTTGAINANPAAYIPDKGLTIAQINELRGELAQKHPRITATASLPQALVTSLPSDLAARATTERVAAGLAGKHPRITATASLPQALVTGLTSDLAARATAQQLADAIATREPLFAELPQARVTQLVSDLRLEPPRSSSQIPSLPESLLLVRGA